MFPGAKGPVANTDTKLLIYRLFQKARVLAQDGVQERGNQLAMLDTFFGALRPQESLCFFYAKQTPLSNLCLLFIHPRAPNLISLRSAGTMPA